MALLLLLFCLAYGSQVRTSGIIPEDVQAGYFRGRSGNIVFKELQDQTVDSAVFLLDPASHLKVLDDSASLSGYEFADIVTSSLGLEKLNNAVAPSIVGKDMFNPVRANVLFVVESLGTEMATRMSLPNLGNNGDGAFASGAKKNVEMKIHPANSLALLTSLVSGTPPSSHGIIGRSWKSKAEGRVVDAFSSASSGSQVANLADLLSQSLPQSFSLSVSSDKQLASANAINLALDNSSSVVLSLNQRTQGFEASSSSFASLSQSREQILSNLKGEKSCLFALQAGSAPVHARINNDLVVVDFPSAWGQGRDSATFDLHVPADYTFFAELQFVHTLPERLSLASGKAPHLHTVVLASTTQLIEKYGRESPEVRAAFHLLDAWLPQVNQKWLSAYQNDAVSEVILLGSHQSVAQGADSRDVLRRLVQIMPNQEGIQEFFPSLYLDDKQALRLCQYESDLLPITVQPYGFGVYCPWFSLAPRTDALNSLTSSSLFALTADNNTNNTNTSGPTANAVERYQVALWISIIMAFAVYWAVYSTVFMSFKKDTMLYSSFNPNWEDRKRR